MLLEEAIDDFIDHCVIEEVTQDKETYEKWRREPKEINLENITKTHDYQKHGKVIWSQPAPNSHRSAQPMGLNV